MFVYKFKYSPTRGDLGNDTSGFVLLIVHDHTFELKISMWKCMLMLMPSSTPPEAPHNERLMNTG